MTGFALAMLTPTYRLLVHEIILRSLFPSWFSAPVPCTVHHDEAESNPNRRPRSLPQQNPFRWVWAEAPFAFISSSSFFFSSPPFHRVERKSNPWVMVEEGRGHTWAAPVWLHMTLPHTRANFYPPTHTHQKGFNPPKKNHGDPVSKYGREAVSRGALPQKEWGGRNWKKRGGGETEGGGGGKGGWVFFSFSFLDFFSISSPIKRYTCCTNRVLHLCDQFEIREKTAIVFFSCKGKEVNHFVKRTSQLEKDIFLNIIKKTPYVVIKETILTYKESKFGIARPAAKQKDKASLPGGSWAGYQFRKYHSC